MSKDPREEQISLENHTIWEADNRVEQRWQWGAMVLDLCDMDPEEYATTIFYTKDAPTTKTRNVLTVTVGQSSALISYQYTPASPITMVIKDIDGEEDVFTIPTGEPSPFVHNLENVNPQKVSKIFIGESYEKATTNKYSDDTYEYVAVKKSSESNIAKFCVIKHTIVEDGLTEEELVGAGIQDMTVVDKEGRGKFNVPAVSVPGLNDASYEDYMEALLREQCDLVVLTNTKFSRAYEEDVDVTANWSKNYTTMSFGGVQYYVSRFVSEAVVNMYDPDAGQTPQEVGFNYRITME